MLKIKQLYLDHLDSLKDEILAYKDENNLWKLKGEIKNTPGNLCLHICGNLNHFYGAILGKTDYVRNRELEFSKKNVSRDGLIQEIENTKKMIEKIFDNLKPDDFNSSYSDNTFGENVTVGFVMCRLIAHLDYHLGQINYHRRILDK